MVELQRVSGTRHVVSCITGTRNPLDSVVTLQFLRKEGFRTVLIHAPCWHCVILQSNAWDM